MITGGVTLTWLLIAALNVAVGGTLFGWIHEGHQAGCEHRSRVFVQAQMEEKTQGPIQEECR
jgi:hypothetical protein